MSSSASMSLVKGPAPQVERTSEEGSKARRLSQTFRGLQTPSISDIMYVRVMMPFKRSRVADLVRYFSKDGANKEETFDIVQLEDYEVKTADNYPLLPVIVRLSLCPVHNNCIICKDVSDDSNVQHITPTAVPASLSILKTHIPSDNAVTSYPPRLSSLKSPYSLEIPPYMYKGTVLIPRHDSGYETIYEDPDEDASATKSEFDINFDDAEIIMKKDCGNQAADDDIEVINQYDLLNDMEEDEDSDDSDGGVKLTGEFADPYAENVLVEKPDINKPLPPSPSFGTSTPESNEPFPSYDEELALEDSYAQQAFDAQVQKTLAEVSIESGLLFIFGQKN